MYHFEVLKKIFVVVVCVGFLLLFLTMSFFLVYWSVMLKIYTALGYRSMVEHTLNLHEVLGQIPTITLNKAYS